MFSKFNVQDLILSEFECFIDAGDTLYRNLERTVHDSLNSFVGNDGTIDGTSLQDSWFPTSEKYDIFLSHSHQDFDLAKGFSGWLYETFGLKAFIDACLWGYSDKLLRDIDNSYCRFEEGSSYNYTKRNYSTSHVHMMLSIALSKVIDNTECIMFLNTPNSISWKDEIKAVDKDSNTKSPWIYHELAMTSLIRNKKITDYRKKLTMIELSEKRAIFESQQQLNVTYDVSEYVKELIPLKSSDLSSWRRTYLSEDEPGIVIESPLDALYINKGIIKCGYK